MHNTALFAEPDTGPLFTTDSDIDAYEALHRAHTHPQIVQTRVTEQVAEVAKHFAEVYPDRPITEAAWMSTAVLVAGTVGRARPLLRALPFVSSMPAGITRGDYARHLQNAGDGDLPPSPIHVPGIPRQPQRPDNTMAVAA